MVSRSTPPTPSAIPPELSFEDFVLWSIAVSDLGAATGRRGLGGTAGRIYLGGQLWIQETPSGFRTVMEGQEKLDPELRTLEHFLFDQACEQGLCRRKHRDQ